MYSKFSYFVIKPILSSETERKKPKVALDMTDVIKLAQGITANALEKDYAVFCKRIQEKNVNRYACDRSLGTSWVRS